MKSDDRRLKILETVVDEYIRTGEPVGSKTIAAMFGNSVSSATIRNDMATLEKLGFLEQPHASAGRVPTYLGYRMYISNLMHPRELTEEEKEQIDEMIGRDNLTASTVLDNALEALAELTGCAVVNASELPKFSVITRVEVVPAGKRLYALLMITSAGDVRNKICRLEFDLSNEQLEYFENLLNQQLLGLRVEDFSPSVMQQLSAAMGSYMLSLSPLLYAAYELSDEIAKRHVDIKGETNLLRCGDFDAGELMRFMSAKNEIDKILTSAFDGINIVFGKETDKFAITNSSMILTKYGMGETMGSLGIIGPIRLDYAKVIPYIEYFSQCVSRMIDDMIEDRKKGELTDGKR